MRQNLQPPSAHLNSFALSSPLTTLRLFNKQVDQIHLPHVDTNYQGQYAYPYSIVTLISFLWTLPTILTSEFLLCNYRLQLASRHTVFYWFCVSFFFKDPYFVFFSLNQTATFLTADIYFYTSISLIVPSAVWKLCIVKNKSQLNDRKIQLLGHLDLLPLF